MAEDLARLLARLETLEGEVTSLRHELAERLVRRDLPEGVISLLICRTSSGPFTILLDYVEEVLPIARFFQLPEAAPWILGSLNLRGESLTVLDVERRLTGRSRSLRLTDRIVVCRSAHHHAGLLVEEVCDLRSVDAESACHPAPGTRFAPYLIALLHHAKESLPLVDVDRLLSLSSLPQAEASRALS